MSDQFDTSPISAALQNSQEICIALGGHPTLDAVAASLSLYLSFIAVGKKVTVTCPSPMVVGFSRLVGLDKISPQLGSRNLVISFDYQKDSIEKVSYHVAGDKFNLVVLPKKGKPPLDPASVGYSFEGVAADLIFIVDAAQSGDLGKAFLEHEAEFAKAYTISINRTLENHFAKTTITDPAASSICEITAWLLEQLGYMPKGDVAGNLLAGMDDQTQRFSAPSTPASAFTIAGRLIQNGAVRQSEIIRPVTPNGLPICLPPPSGQSAVHRPPERWRRRNSSQRLVGTKNLPRLHKDIISNF